MGAIVERYWLKMCDRGLVAERDAVRREYEVAQRERDEALAQRDATRGELADALAAVGRYCVWCRNGTDNCMDCCELHPCKDGKMPKKGKSDS